MILATCALARPSLADAERRTNTIVITSFCYGLATLPGIAYYGFDQPGGRPLWWIHAGLTPSIPRLTVHDWLGATLFSAARMTSLLLAERWRTVEDKAPRTRTGDEFIVLGFVLPIIAGIADIATTPSQPEPSRSELKTRPAVGVAASSTTWLLTVTYAQ